MPTELYAFRKDTADALLSLVKTVGDTNGERPVDYDSCGVIVGTANGNITARSGTTLGTGSVNMKSVDPDTGATSAMSVSKLGTTTSTVTVYNPGSLITSGSYVLCFRSGRSWIAVGVC